MYIPEFWCGVGATIIIEIAVIVAGVIYTNKRGKKNE